MLIFNNGLFIWFRFINQASSFWKPWPLRKFVLYPHKKKRPLFGTLFSSKIVFYPLREKSFFEEECNLGNFVLFKTYIFCSERKFFSFEKDCSPVMNLVLFKNSILLNVKSFSFEEDSPFGNLVLKNSVLYSSQKNSFSKEDCLPFGKIRQMHLWNQTKFYQYIER